jgi:hypothetical protein
VVSSAARGGLSPADAALSQQRRAAEYVAHDRQLRLAVDNLLGHRIAVRAGERGGHGASVPRVWLDDSGQRADRRAAVRSSACEADVASGAVPFPGKRFEVAAKRAVYQ